MEQQPIQQHSPITRELNNKSCNRQRYQPYSTRSPVWVSPSKTIVPFFSIPVYLSRRMTIALQSNTYVVHLLYYQLVVAIYKRHHQQSVSTIFHIISPPTSLYSISQSQQNRIGILQIPTLLLLLLGYSIASSRLHWCGAWFIFVHAQRNGFKNVPVIKWTTAILRFWDRGLTRSLDNQQLTHLVE